MKFGKEKLPKSEASKNTSKTQHAAHLQSPFIYVGLASLLAAVVVVATLFIHQSVIILPLQNELQNEVSNSQLQAMNLVFSEKLTYLQKQVAHFAAGIPNQDYTGLAEVRQAQAEQALKAMPGSLRALVSARGRAARDSQAPLPVSFASLDLIRSVEETQKIRLEAFAVEDNWYVQIVVPALDENKQTLGTLLVMFDSKVLEPDWSVVPEGGLQLQQQVGNAPRPVISHGVMSDKVLTATTLLPQWSVAYSPDSSLQSTPDMMTLIILAVVGAMVAGAAVAAIGLALLKNVRKDISVVSIYTQKVLQGEKVALPKVKITLLHSLLVRISQIVKSTSGQSKSGAKSSPAPRKPPQAEINVARKVVSSKEPEPDFSDEAAATEVDNADFDGEPLFQGDSLDIDMLGEDDDLLGLNDEDLGLDQSVVGEFDIDEGTMVDVPAEIFRAYDIRGVFGETLTGAIMREIGRALGSEAINRGADTICIGMDGRLSSPELAQTLTQGLLATGINVVDVGVVPTPVLYFAIEHLNLAAGAMITGSHNPPEYNGLKMVIQGETLAQEDNSKLLARIQSQNFASGRGALSAADVRNDYVETIINDIAVAAPLKVVLDAGNGVASELAPYLITELGCEVTPLYCDINGSFPNHHPDPSRPENLQDLIAKVKETGADIGIAFDGDGDRIGVVTNAGTIIWPDRLLMLFAKDVVSRNPGADVVFDVKCSRRLNGLISSFGGRPVMWRTGHSLMKAKMKETGALLGGEMSGHIFFKERWYGFDDGIYSAARLLEILGIDDRDAQTIFEEFPEDISTPELHIPVPESAKFGIIENLSLHGDWGDASISTIDGLRVDYADGWGLCRASNTTPNLVLRFEAETEDGLTRIQEIFRRQLLSLDHDLSLPF